MSLAPPQIHTSQGHQKGILGSYLTPFYASVCYECRGSRRTGLRSVRREALLMFLVPRSQIMLAQTR